ncbi:hypothetical protein TNCV_2784561 [Trichonephila clavipes]|nr:hypothetical protein TNCV_2784561 [Trichonephila clavipes]
MNERNINLKFVLSIERHRKKLPGVLKSWCLSQNITHKEFLPEGGTTMNAARYIEILIRFMKRLHRVRPQYAQRGHYSPNFIVRGCMSELYWAAYHKLMVVKPKSGVEDKK